MRSRNFYSGRYVLSFKVRGRLNGATRRHNIVDLLTDAFACCCDVRIGVDGFEVGLRLEHGVDLADIDAKREDLQRKLDALDSRPREPEEARQKAIAMHVRKWR